MSKQNTAIIGILGLVLMVSLFGYSYAGQVYSTNKASYYSQYNYNYNSVLGSQYYAVNSWGKASQPWTLASFPYRGSGPYLYSGSPSYNPLFGYSYTYNSHMFIDNALDYQYYTHPELLAPRRMQNNQRYYRGLFPQAFLY
ncbi:hypothetical protein JW711_01100 [Candidatus Woesearchaeota archaeon]|nr:hypothetical protein [Candidatus Woesearchaeota archaeon]